MAKKNEVTTTFKGEDKTSKTADQVESRLKRLGKNWAVIGAGMMAISAGITAGLLSTVKSASEEEAGIVRLSVAMKNVGLSYDDAREKLEAWIDKNQQYTSFADDEQRSALASLVRMTGDLGKAQEMLTVAMDIGVGTGRDLASANTLVMYAMGGNWGMLERYIPALKLAVTEEEKWMKLRQLFSEQAVEFGGTMAGQFKTLENNIGDLKESIGKALLPAMQSILEPVQTFVGYMKEHPQITQMVAVVGALTAGVLGLGGAYILVSNIMTKTFIPAIISTAKWIWGTLIPALTAKLALMMAILATTPFIGIAMLASAVGAITAFSIGLPMMIKDLTKPKLFGSYPNPELEGTASAIPLMDNGGVVPGRAGSLQPVYARGGEVFSGYPPGKMGGDTIIIQAQAFMGSREEARRFAEMIFNEGRRNNRRTVGRTA